MHPISPLLSKQWLDELYRRFNRREFVHPDPIEFLYAFPALRDRELIGLIASSLAYGRVRQILKSVASVLERMNHAPYAFLHSTSRKRLFVVFRDFRHRFSTGDEMAMLLWGARRLTERYGSLHGCFLAGYCHSDDTVLSSLTAFVGEFHRVMPKPKNSLIPVPGGKSACKRLNLFLRWMVRHDDVDPGGWNQVPESKLIVPLDTHMHRICRLLKLTHRNQADMRTAVEITRRFREISPEDPVRYDFSLTRLGILHQGGMTSLLGAG